MACKIDIIESIKPDIFSRSLTLLNKTPELTKEKGVEFILNKLNGWTKPDSLTQSSVSPTVTEYNFNGVKSHVMELLNTWIDNKILKQLPEDSPEELKLEVNQRIELITEIIEDSILQFQENIRKENINYPTNPIINEKPLIDFSSVSVLLNNSDAMLHYLNSELSKIVNSATFINTYTSKASVNLLTPTMDTFVKNIIGANNNILGIKCRLWADVVTATGRKFNANLLYVKTEEGWALNKGLFQPDKTGLSPYEQIIQTLKNKYDDLSKKTLLSSHFTTAQAYIKMLILLNFDNFLSQQFSSHIKINPDSANTWGMPNNGEYKYQLDNISALTSTWAPDSTGENDISDSESNQFKLIASSIPFKEFIDSKSQNPTDFKGTEIIGLYLNGNLINTAAAVLLDIPNDITFTIGNSEHNIQKWFELLETEQITLKQLLESILANHTKNDSLAQVINTLYSIYDYLYNKNNGIHNAYLFDRSNNYGAISVINVESILLNQFRNVRKTTYVILEHETDLKSRMIDILLIDSKVSDDFKHLFSGLSLSWQNNQKSMASHKFWENPTFKNFINFLEVYGKAEFSPRTITKYESEVSGVVSNENIFNETTVNNLRKYFLTQPKGFVSKWNDTKEDFENIEEPLGEEDWIELIRRNTPSSESKEKLFSDLDLIKLFKLKHRDEGFNEVTQISNAEGEKFPVLSVLHLASDIKNIVNKEKETTTDSIKLNILNSLENFAVLLEGVNQDGSKPIKALSANDNLTLGLFDQFYGWIFNNGKIIIQPYNYADKSKILGLVVDYKQLSGDQQFNSKAALSQLKTINGLHFQALANSIISDYIKLFPKERLTTIQKIDEFISSKSRTFLLKAVDQYNKNHQSNPLYFIEEIHYSLYGKNNISFNKLLKVNIEIWTDSKSSLFNEFVKQQEQSFLSDLNIELDITNTEYFKGKYKFSSPKSVMTQFKEKFGFSDSDFSIKYKTKSVKNGDVTEEQFVEVNGEKVIDKVFFAKTDENGNLSEPLKRYLWTRNLVMSTVTNVMTKGSFIHPVKKNTTISPTQKISMSDIVKEENERTIAFFKRMVQMGGSITRWKRGGDDGLPKNILIAAMDDPTRPVFTYSGVSDNQKTFDGEVLVSPFGTQILIDALPGFGLSRVMKPLGMSMGRFHSSFLKCAFMGITNEMILSSLNSEYSLLNVMEKMHKIPFKEGILTKYVKLYHGDIDGNITSETVSKNVCLTEALTPILESLYIEHNGEWTHITNIGMGSQLNEYVVRYENDEKNHVVPINNFYDLWMLFGGPFSREKVGNKLVKSEKSIDLVNYIIKLQSINGKSDFKNDMIYMLVPRQAMKSGIINPNLIEKFQTVNKEELSTMPYSTEYLGIQLDASYNPDDSSISEVTQVYSALSENNAHPEFYNTVYETTARIIEDSLSEFRELGSKQFTDITKIFIKNLSTSTTVENANIILNNLEEDLKDKIPFTDRTLFKQFISTTISNINKTFIRKKISGAGMILNASDNMIGIYEDINGKIYLVSDLLDEFDNTPQTKLPINVLQDLANPTKTALEKAQIKIQHILSKSHFTKVLYKSITAIEPLDRVQVIDSKTNAIVVETSLNDINDYYTFLRTYKNSGYQFYKMYNNVRDLNPAKKSFSFIEQNVDLFNTLLTKFTETPEVITEEQLNNLGISKSQRLIIQEGFLKSLYGTLPVENFSAFVNYYLFYASRHTNGFAIEAVANKFDLETIVSNNSKSPTQKLEEVLQIDFTNKLHNYLLKHNIRYKTLQEDLLLDDLTKLTALQRYAERFSQRHWDLLSQKKTFKEYDGSDTYFESILQRQDGTFDTLDFGIDKRNPIKGTLDIFNYIEKDLEIISSKMDKAQFKLHNISHAQVSPNTFKNWFTDATNRKIYKYYDIIFNNIYDSEKSLQVRFTKLSTLQNYKNSLGPSKIWKAGIYLLDENNDLVVTTNEEGLTNLVAKRVHIITDVITKQKQLKTFRKNSLGEMTYTVDAFKSDNGYDIFRTEDGREIGITTWEKFHSFTKDNFNYFGIVDVNDSNRVSPQIYDQLISELSDYNLKEYFRTRKIYSGQLTKIRGDKTKSIQWNNIENSIKKLRNDYYQNISYKIFNSWILSHDVIGSRIPAQAGQSYSSCKVVAYMHDNENSVYVSRWQIFLQGSDYDIDKLYIMKFDLQNGLFQGWSPYFDLTTFDKIKESLQLPIPTGLTYQRFISSETTVANTSEILDLDIMFPWANDIKLTLSDRVRILNYISKNWNKNQHKFIKTGNDQIFKTITKHNKFYSDESFNNYKVYQIMKISRSPKNQLTNYTPVSFGDYRSLSKPKTTNISLYNPYAMYLQQENNYIGRDVIGISATGIKSYFSLVTYFSKYYESEQMNPTDSQMIFREYTVNGIKRVVTHIAGLNLSEWALKNLKRNLANALLKNQYEKKEELGGGVYTEEELLSYIDSVDDIDNPALKLSALLSAATDNAKELLLADINAGIDFAGVHLYLIIMGFNEMDVAKEMTSELVLKIKDYVQDSFLSNKPYYGVNYLLRTLTADKLGFDNSKKIIYNKEKAVKDTNKFIIYNLLQDSKISHFFTSRKSSSGKINLVELVETSKSKETFLQQLALKIDDLKDQISLKPITKEYTVKKQQNELTALTSSLASINATDFLFEGEFSEEELASLAKTQSIEEAIDNFRKIYFHSRELLQIGKSLAINQGVKATLEDSYAITQNVNSTILMQQSEFFRQVSEVEFKTIEKLIAHARTLSVWYSLEEDIKNTVASDLQNIGIKVTNPKVAILEINQYLQDLLLNVVKQDKPYLPDEYIVSTLANVTSAGIITHGIDNYKFLTDVNYKKIVSDYLNLIKYNFNTVDILDSLPHFKYMTESAVYGNYFLEKNLLGYKFITQVMPKLVDIMTFNNEISVKTTLSKVRTSGKPSNPVVLDSSILDKTQDVLYERMLVKWLRHLPFNLDFSHYIFDHYKNEKIKIIKNNKNEVEYDTVNTPSDLQVDLSTEYGWAKFKYLMEVYVLPQIKADFSSNGFLKSYSYRKGIGYNMKKMIKFYQSGNNALTTLKLEQGLELLIKDPLTHSIPVKSDKDFTQLESMSIIDLLVIYDKMQNLGRFGGNRSTIFINKNRGGEDSLMSDFLRFQSNFEYSEDTVPSILRDIEGTEFDNPEQLDNRKLYREALYLTLFGYTHKDVRQYITSMSEIEDEKPRPVPNKLENGYFKLVTSLSDVITLTPDQVDLTKERNEVMQRLLSSNGILKTKCKT